MAFVVEDGTAKADATSYVDIAFIDDYFADRGDTIWDSLADQDKRVALIKATDYVDKRFRIQFIGARRTRTQALAWPRCDAVYEDGEGWWVPDDEVPKELKQAVCEYALQVAITGELISKEASSATAAPKVGEMIKVGPITVSDKYAETSAKSRVTGVDVISDSNISEYPAADLLLQPILESSMTGDLIRG